MPPTPAVPRHHGCRDEVEAAEGVEGVQLEEYDIVLHRTGRYGRRFVLGPWLAGAQKAGLHPDAMPLLDERRLAAAGFDGDGDAVCATEQRWTFGCVIAPLRPVGGTGTIC